MSSNPDLLEQLSSFCPDARAEALRKLLAANPEPAKPESDWLNMHMHTFFSFNGEGWSPSRLAWETREQGLYSMAICDFDVLQGLDEIFAATDLLQVRAAVGFESRVFFREYADKEINSPGEPGVFYFMGMGFTAPPKAGSKGAEVLADMLARSHARNRALIGRINTALADLALDYDKDVIPLTPEENATERHIVRAYYDKSLATFGDGAAAFWASKLGLDPVDTAEKIGDVNAFNDLLRSKLMKKGGAGYAQPDENTFPLLDDVIGMIQECRAIPMSAWLDGTRAGESNPVEQLECLREKGVVAVNIIPDRNWNVKDSETATKLVRELNRYIAAAKSFDMPINIGTELNKPGQRFVDDFAADALKPYHQDFLEGAQVMVGHTRLLRWADYSYIDQVAEDDYPMRPERNAFFASVGVLPGPDAETLAKLNDLGPEKALSYLRSSASHGEWR
jgi:hypothetical protein